MALWTSLLSGLVLDEADEMLRMGFIEDVETIMAQIPEGHQTALFSATMPEAIRRITRRFMKEPQEVRIQSSVTTRPDISQSYWTVWGMRKNEALVRFLEAEDFDAAIIFVRTKNATLEVAEALERNGYNSAALNGDMNQALREQTLERLKDGRLDILIATDVAAVAWTLSVSAWWLTTISRWILSLTFTVSVVPVVQVVLVVHCCSLRTVSVVCCATSNAP